jgi:hypothetical protein
LGPGAVSGNSDATEFHATVGLGGTLNGGFLNPLDLNFDGSSNGKDVFVFPLGWMKFPGQSGYRSGGDLNGDSRIGPDDLLIYLQTVRRQ